MHLGDRFFKYKQDVNTLRDTVERHFSKVINEIEAGLPIVCVEEVEEEDDEDEDFFTKAKNWTCINCTRVNEMRNISCHTCSLFRPDIAKKNAKNKK